MTDLTSFYRTDEFNDHVADDVNRLIAATMRSEFKNVETLSTTRALLDVDTPIQRYECGAADRNVTAPTGNTTTNHPFWIVNASAAARTITVQNAAGSATIGIIPQGCASLFVPDGNGSYLPSAQNVPAYFALSGILSPSQITSNQNDYSPTGLSTATILRLSTDASRDLTGLAGGGLGRIVVVHNVGTNNLVLKDESASSTAANRFALSADVTLSGDQSVMMQYDATSSRWRVIGGSGGTSSEVDFLDIQMFS